MIHDLSSQSSLRARTVSQHLLRAQSTNVRLLKNDKSYAYKDRRFLRWTSCFAFVTKFKKPKSKTDLSDQTSSITDSYRTVSDVAISPSVLSVSIDRQSISEDTRSSIDTVASSVHQWKAIPDEPPSALSPRPRCKKERGCSMAPFPSEPFLVVQRPRAKTLRLSFDVEHQLTGVSHSSSVFSTDSDAITHRDDIDYDADTASSICTSTSLACFNRARASSLMTLARARGSLRFSLSNCIQSDYLRPLTRTVSTPGSLLKSSPLRQKSPLSSVVRISASPPDTNKLPIKERRRFTEGDKLTVMLEDEDEDYDDLLNRFQIPSLCLPEPEGSRSATGCPTEKEAKPKSKEEDPRRYSIALARQQTMQTLIGSQDQDAKWSSKSLDIIRDKAYYEAVVRGTIHHRPWTQAFSAQPNAEETHDNLQIPCGDRIQGGPKRTNLRRPTKATTMMASTSGQGLCGPSIGRNRTSTPQLKPYYKQHNLSVAKAS